MPHLYSRDRLSAEDAAFLYLEKKEMPLHIASISIFDGPIPYQDCVEYIESRLPLIPRYRQRIVVPPFHVGHPTWEDDPNFDIHNHVRHARVKRGDQAGLESFAGKRLETMMDRSKPLWEMTVVDGLHGGRSALISRVHHCLVDGVSGVGLMNVMLDPKLQANGRGGHRPAHPRPLPGPAASLLDALASSYSDAVERVLSAQMAALDIAQAFMSEQALRGAAQLARLLPELVTPVERLPFNKPCLGPRKVAWTEIAIPEVSAVREACGGTLNDVVLTVVTLGVGRYSAMHRVSPKKRLLRLMVPVSLRRNGDHNGLGNRVSMLPVSVPLDIHDPVKLLDAIHQRTEVLKEARVADLVHLFGSWLGTTPAPLQALLGPLAATLPLPPFNMVCTNVPGPQVPLYALGRKMLTYYPYVPIGNEMAVGCAIQSYNQKLYFGLTADAAAAPDVGRLRDFLAEAFVALKAAAGLSARPGKQRPPKAAPLDFTAYPERVYNQVRAPANGEANGRKAGAYS